MAYKLIVQEQTFMEVMIVVMSFVKFKSIVDRALYLFLMDVVVLSNVLAVVHFEIVVRRVFTFEVALAFFWLLEHLVRVIHEFMRLNRCQQMVVDFKVVQNEGVVVFFQENRGLVLLLVFELKLFAVDVDLNLIVESIGVDDFSSLLFLGKSSSFWPLTFDN